MTRRLTTEQKNMLFETRKSIIDYNFNWQLKTFYGFMFLMGAIVVAIISNPTQFKEMTGQDAIFFSIGFLFFGTLFLAILEVLQFRSFYKLHNELIGDVINNNLDKKLNFSALKQMYDIDYKRDKTSSHTARTLRSKLFGASNTD